MPLTARLRANRSPRPADSLFTAPSHAAPAKCLRSLHGALASAPAANHRATSRAIRAKGRSLIMHATPCMCILFHTLLLRTGWGCRIVASALRKSLGLYKAYPNSQKISANAIPTIQQRKSLLMRIASTGYCLFFCCISICSICSLCVSCLLPVLLRR